MAKGRSMTDTDHSLALRAAWLHYVGGMRQAEVAKRLDVPSVKAHRLIQKAVSEGAVKVSIEGDIVECIELEAALCRRYELQTCEVAPALDEDGIPLRALGAAGASWLRRCLEKADNLTIGLSHGRTLTAAVQSMPHMTLPDQRFVSLLGGLTRNFAANPHDVMHLLAEKTDAQAYVMPVPFYANSAEDRDVLLNQRGISDILKMANAAQIKLVGIGSVSCDAQLVVSGLISSDEIAAISEEGGRGEVLGHFFDENGNIVDTPLTKRTIAASLGDRRDRGDRIIALAGGPHKVDAIRAVLNSDALSGLITDERTARDLLAD